MSFDLADLRQAIAAHGPVSRVVIADVQGSSPREVGAAMLVWDAGQSGTIGGGALEFEMARRARAGHQGLTRHALGPDLGQCCGGAVQIVTERLESVPEAHDGLIARQVAGAESALPLSAARALSHMRNGSGPRKAQLVSGWFIEPVAAPTRQIWIWGAGHVGRALTEVLSPLPDMAITWIDSDAGRFPDDTPSGIAAVPTADMPRLAAHAPRGAEHVIVTYSHAIDLALCDALLGHEFAFCGLIGSKTKWARFRNRLTALGHCASQIARITCPIGDPDMGKYPQAIAIGVGASLLIGAARLSQIQDKSA